VRLAVLAWTIVLLLIAFLLGPTARAAEPSLGPAGAPVTVEVYCDYLCPNCAAARPALRRLLASHPGQVRLVLRDFPVVHADSGRVAEAAACANDQGRLAGMREFLFDRQRTLTETAVRQEARRLGMDGARFDHCLGSRTHTADWQRDQARGRTLGVSATPSFVVGGRVLEGLNERALEGAVRRQLGQQAETTTR
jgi:protein-disulfide isomerase